MLHMFIAPLLLIHASCASNRLEKPLPQRRSPATGIEWAETTLTLVRERGIYARMIRLADGGILCSYDCGGKIYVSRSDDNGRTWGEETPAASAIHGGATNAELLQLEDGWILLSFNERPGDKLHPYAIKLCISRDNARTWSAPETLFEAGILFEDGCWEPAQIQLPSGEVQLYFANESPYRKSNEQEISMMRSFDNGLTWSAPERVIFRIGGRDGMPSPLCLLNGKGIAVAVEDTAFGLPFKPSIAHTSLEANWRDGFVAWDSPRRRPGLAQQLPPLVYGGAPCLRQLPTGETVLSFQCNEGREHPQMVVCLGDSSAANFGSLSVPFKLPTNVAGLWNSLLIKDADTVTAVSGTTINGKWGIWAIDGHIVRNAPATAEH
ncbi:MAG TPA: sialidase family protein [Candidatus Brocadiia bacterium]|nr:sialidase family protein [Candidatus Brocadiia bacterium]